MLRTRLFPMVAMLALAAGGCSSLLETIAPPGGEEARWGLDPTVRLADDATTIPILVNEVGCASGMDASGRISDHVTYTETEVVITVRVAPPPGDAQDCPSNPNTPFNVELSEPLGGRELVNGATSEIALRPIEFVGDGPGVPDEPVDGLTIEWAPELAGAGMERLNFLVQSFHVRAQDPSELADLTDLSLHPDGVELILGRSGLSRTVARDDLADPTNWEFDPPDGYEGFSGPFSLLTTLEGRDRLKITVGGHPHCAGPARAAPAHLADLTRVGVEPTDIDSCIQWFGLDLYLDDDGLVVAILLDLFGP